MNNNKINIQNKKNKKNKKSRKVKKVENMKNCGILLSNTNLEKLKRHTDDLRISCTAQGYTDSTAVEGMPYMYVIKLKDYNDVMAVIDGLNNFTNSINQQRAQELTTKYKFLYNAAQNVGAIGWIKR